MSSAYTSTVRQLLDIAPVVFTTPHFALKGGTALNLFLHYLPRLSVDIDVVFTTTASAVRPRCRPLPPSSVRSARS